MKCAVIGLGIGMAHVAGYLRHPSAELVAVADRLPERRAAIGGTFAAGSMRVLEPLYAPTRTGAGVPLAPDLLAKRWEEIGVTVHDDAAAIIADPAIELVSLCTPDDTHEALAIALLDAGKRVLLEKPVALSETGAERVRLAAERAAAARPMAPGGADGPPPRRPPLPIGVGYEFRLNPAVQELQRRVTGRRIGRPRAFSLYHYRTPFRRDKFEGWIQSRARSGGLLVEETCHWFDLARWIMADEWASVHAVGVDDIHTDFDFEDVAYVQGRFASGAAFQISHSLTGFDFSLVLQVHGTQGTAWCGLKEAPWSALDGGATTYHAIVASGPLGGESADADVQTFGPEATEPFNIEAMAMAAVDIAAGHAGRDGWPATLDDGISSLRIALAAQRALDQRREISLS